MDFAPTETQALIAQTAREFATRRIAPIAGELDRQERFPLELVQGLAELGLLGVNVKAAWGGADAGAIAYALAMKEVAKACASTAVTMAVTNMVAEVIQRFGSDEQRERHLPAITSGRYVTGAFALSEPQVGSDPSALATTAKRVPDGWVLDGQKQWITTGVGANRSSGRQGDLVLLGRARQLGPHRGQG